MLKQRNRHFLYKQLALKIQWGLLLVDGFNARSNSLQENTHLQSFKTGILRSNQFYINFYYKYFGIPFYKYVYSARIIDSYLTICILIILNISNWKHQKICRQKLHVVLQRNYLDFSSGDISPENVIKKGWTSLIRQSTSVGLCRPGSRVPPAKLHVFRH
jgi:hypothetical protein